MLFRSNICTIDGSLHVRLADGSVIPATEASEATVGVIQELVVDYAKRLNSGEANHALHTDGESAGASSPPVN